MPVMRHPTFPPQPRAPPRTGYPARGEIRNNASHYRGPVRGRPGGLLRAIITAWKKIDLFCRFAALLVGEVVSSMRRIDQGHQALRLVKFSSAGLLCEKSCAAKYLGSVGWSVA